MAITSAFQADNVGSTPSTRSSKTNEALVLQHWRFFVGKGLLSSFIVTPNYNRDQL